VVPSATVYVHPTALCNKLAHQSSYQAVRRGEGRILALHVPPAASPGAARVCLDCWTC
jgi:hypothetical protein